MMKVQNGCSLMFFFCHLGITEEKSVISYNHRKRLSSAAVKGIKLFLMLY
jgi:hypothetical protein